MTFNFDRGDYMDFADPEESNKEKEFDAKYGKGSLKSRQAFEQYKKEKKYERVQAGRQRTLKAVIDRYKTLYPKEFKAKHPNGVNTKGNPRAITKKLNMEMEALERSKKARAEATEKRNEARRTYKDPSRSASSYAKEDLKRRKVPSVSPSKGAELSIYDESRRKTPIVIGPKAPAPVSEEEKGWLTTLDNIDQWVYKHKTVNNLIATGLFRGGYAIGNTIGGLLGFPMLGHYIGKAFEFLWQNRRDIIKGWKAIKGWITKFKNRKITVNDFKTYVDQMTLERIQRGAIPDRPSGNMGADLPGFVDAQPRPAEIVYDRPLAITWRNEDRNDEESEFSLRASVVDLIMNDSTAARLLFESPGEETVASLLAKYNPNLALPPGAMETIQNLVTKDQNIRDLLTTINQGVLQLEGAREGAEAAMSQDNLIGVSAALSTVDPNNLGSITNTATISQDNGGSIEMGGISNALYGNFEAVKKVTEEYMNTRAALKAAQESEENLETEIKAKEKEFEYERDSIEKRKITEDDKAYEERVKLSKTKLDEMTAQFTKIYEDYTKAQAMAKNLAGEKEALEKALQDEGDRNIKLTDDLTALSLKGQQQFHQIEGMQKDLDATKKSADLFQKLWDEGKEKIKQLTMQKEAELDKMRTENSLKEKERQRKIEGLEKKIADLTNEVENAKNLIEAGKRRQRQLADDVVAAEDRGRRGNSDLLDKFQTESNELRSQVESLEGKNKLYELQSKTLKEEKDKLQTESEIFKTKIATLESELHAGQQAQTQFDAIDSANQTRIGELQRQIDRCNKENADLQSQILGLMTADSEMKEALAAAKKQNVELEKRNTDLSLQTMTELRKAGKKFRDMKATYQKGLDAALNKLKELEAKEKAYRKIIYDSEHGFSFIPKTHPVLKEAVENLPEVIIEQIEVGTRIQEQRRDLWEAMNGTKKPSTRARIGEPGGAYLTGKAPDWNLQPNERIRKFWTDFYNASFHPSL